jgi:hypothetical protein
MTRSSWGIAFIAVLCVAVMIIAGCGSASVGTATTNQNPITQTPNGSALAITTASVANGQLGQPYSATLSASGGAGAEQWSLATGQLPPGLNLSTTGVISGTPTTAGNYVFTVKVTDSSTPVQTASAGLAISVLTPLNLTVSNAGFATAVVIGDVSATPQAITVTNNSGSNVTFVVDHIERASNHAGYGGMMETGSVLVQRNYGNTCQPYVTATATLQPGKSCQFNVYLFPTAAGAVSGTAKVEYVPTPINALISISIGSGVRQVITQNPVANLQVGNYVTIIGTPDDPCCNLGTQITNYNDTRKILSVTDSTHFTIDNSDSPQLAAVNNQGFISDAYPAFDTFVATANVSGTGAAAPAFDAAHPPALPLGIASDYSGTVMDTRYTAPAACSAAVISDAATLTARLQNASCGEVLCLQAGTPIQGLFTLKNIAGCTQYSYLISSDYTNSAFPLAGRRVQPSDEPHLGILQGNNIGPTLQADLGAAYWRVVGVELTRASGVSGSTYGPFYMSKYGFPATGAATVNHHIICDRCYVHRQDADTNGMTVGVEMDGNNLAVIDSYIANIGQASSDDTAIGNCNGNGPIKVVNTYLEATGMATIFGGCDPPWIGSYPQDIEFRNNVYTKRLAWQTSAVGYIKNLLELKNGERVLVTGSLFQYNWADEQAGTAIVFEPANQHGSGVANRVKDVTFDYNVLAHSLHGFATLATGYLYPTAQTRRILIRNMLFQDIGGINSQWVTGGWTCPSSFNCGWLVPSISAGGAGAKYGPTIPMADFAIDHVTSFTPAGVYDMSGAQQGIQNVFTTNNMLLEGNGVAGDAQSPGNSAIGYYMLNPTFKTNAMIGTPTDASNYPSLDPSGSGSQAFWWEDVNTVGTNTNLFTDWGNCNSGTYSISACALNATSYYLPGRIRQASDGKQVGADINGIGNRTACTTTGASCNPLP